MRNLRRERIGHPSKGGSGGRQAFALALVLFAFEPALGADSARLTRSLPRRLPNLYLSRVFTWFVLSLFSDLAIDSLR
ncbi:MAG: hypothetical protein JRM74_02180 [Nitrososphaerota archaeon]|nr:hypothetical protein [Nitrososphaerota archaeon]MDG6969053.1 hypothetical protein [Nitrososphaerota archaeon]MDG6972067.1 hypothetical protein [Nitrososphaerota archaeon]MDG6982242.1 hypothetical protein [Nitrososphaerota archaeon]MDG7014715.1 hypothetical protein [Nitrososphaerota archaeon]